MFAKIDFIYLFVFKNNNTNNNIFLDLSHTSLSTKHMASLCYSALVPHVLAAFLCFLHAICQDVIGNLMAFICGERHQMKRLLFNYRTHVRNHSEEDLASVCRVAT